MNFSIKGTEVKNKVNNLGKINKDIQKARSEVEAVKRQLTVCSSSYRSIARELGNKSNDLERIISVLATMEDGLEQAVALYLSCENVISAQEISRVTIQSAEGTANNIWTGIKDWLSSLQDWLDTGVWDNKEKANRIRRDKAMAKELKNLLKTDRYSKSTWKKASREEREAILRELFEEMEAIYGVSLNHFEIGPIEAEPGYIAYGYFQKESGTMRINGNLLENGDYYQEIMDTMAHEMRHAYQWDVVNNPDSYQMEEGIVEEWRNNFWDYETIEEDGYDAYRDQPIEKDARKFASWVI